MPPLYLRVFERLVLEANHQDNEIPYREKGSKVVGKKLIKRGEKLTSVRDICRWIAWYERGKLKEPNPKTVQDILDWLEENCMIEIYGDKGNRKETHYKIVNYNTYQDKEDEEVTREEQGSNSKVTENKQSLDTNKNVKNDKNVKNNINTSRDNEKELDPEEKKELRYGIDDVNYKAAIHLREKILQVNPGCKVPDAKPEGMQKWANDIRLTFEMDKRTKEGMVEIINFAFSDTFWQTVIKSPSGLRKNWDTMYGQMIRKKSSSGQSYNQRPSKIVNYKQREYDFDELERLEQERIDRELREGAS